MKHPQEREIREIINYCDRMIEISINNLHETLSNNTQIQQVNILADNDFNVQNFLKSNPSVIMSNYIKQNAHRIQSATGELNIYLNLKTILTRLLNGESKEITEIVLEGTPKDE